MRGPSRTDTGTPDGDGDGEELSRQDESTAHPTEFSSRAPSPTTGVTLAPRHTNDKRINEEYKIWKKNIPYLYDLFLMTAMQFPSYTVDWISDVEEIVDELTGMEYHQQKLILGTTARSEDEIALNGIIIMNVRFPMSDGEGLRKMDEKNPEFRPSLGLFTSSPNIMSVHGILAQSFPITNVRAMPQKTELVCAKLADSSVVIYDWKSELRNGWSFDDPVEERPAMLELAGHDTSLTSAHGLAWNPTSGNAGMIASCGKDGRILVWDISGARRRTDVKPLYTITGHETEVQDVAWHPLHSSLIGSAGLDKAFCLFDIRSRCTTKPSHRVEAHDAIVNAISFAMSETIFATGSDDGTIGLWDMRNLGKKLHSLKHHTSDVFTLDWCHDLERGTLLASGGADRRVCLWDVAKINDKPEKTLSDSVITPPELIFVHGGNSGRVTDVTWNPAPGRKLMLASAAEDSIIQVWTPARYQIWPLDHRDPSLKESSQGTTVEPVSGSEATDTEKPASLSV
ncbi:Histone-binding protein RBBP7 [Hypsibius exemplaris]|uniref:Histone-binding protein RBBP7 n=1 Tax=Hypsibius exemplaris TaxID=2072580 RepID=A0A9X6NMQ9_HYPEX|nr:Histone-binding protein RBBP7 [Hypsibius exemplaris]